MPAAAQGLRVRAEPAPHSYWVANVIYRAPARVAPARTARVKLDIDPTTEWGTPTELLVVATAGAGPQRWLRVDLDRRPNGTALWIEARFATLTVDPWSVHVSRAHRSVAVYYRGRRRRLFRAVVGKPSTPTPSGLYAIAAEIRQRDPAGFVGSWVMPLTAHSDVLHRFDGGDGQVALHGRGGVSLLDPLGTALSHGCVRLANTAIDWIAAHVPIGTPVRIS
ncbi:MAG TPA: L,D-transpeptidase [Solirubrobacteraceae bacterium]|nr:L,D-transpeptidase [Solirubrobacteraceae bacterium]